VLLEGAVLLGSADDAMRRLRGDRIAMIFQDPMMTLNPVLRIDTQMIETVLAHEKVSREEARQRARDEMFVLLHAISGAASRALNLDDFLAESIYRIVYSFQSESSVIFLL
jgi:ABC-type microcin C transport system duplicated ATPase subunit YejF